jgi:hypothetical protein
MKHKVSQFKILSECDHGYIGVCECCHEFNFAYKNILITFQEEEMNRFLDWVVTRRNCPQHYMPLRYGRNKVFSSPNSNLFITFHDKELDEVEQLYNEMKIVLEAQRVLVSSRRN